MFTVTSGKARQYYSHLKTIHGIINVSNFTSWTYGPSIKQPFPFFLICPFWDNHLSVIHNWAYHNRQYNKKNRHKPATTPNETMFINNIEKWKSLITNWKAVKNKEVFSFRRHSEAHNHRHTKLKALHNIFLKSLKSQTCRICKNL